MTSCKPERDLIFALFRRIGEQPEFKEVFEKLPNAERNYMAGDFYNIIVSYSNTTDRDKVLDIRNNLYYASTPYGFNIFYGKIAIENLVLEIDFDRRGIIGVDIAELRPPSPEGK